MTDSRPASSIATDASASLQSSGPLAGECVAFTGTLASMVHRDAAALVETSGGRAVQSVSGSVTMLVIGEEGWPLESDGEPSLKLKQATQLIADGAQLRVVAESDWLHLIGLNEQRDEIRRSYTPAMLSRLLEIPVRLIRRWARIGLIRPVRRVCRQLYFDYQEVASAQRLATLLDEGVPPEKLEQSLSVLSQTLAGTDRSLAQLNLLVQDERVLLRDAHGVVNPRTGQRLLDFGEQSSATAEDRVTEAAELKVHVPQQATESTSADDASDVGDLPVSLSFAEARMKLDDRHMNQWTAEEWYNEACRLSEEGAVEAAVNAFRNCLSLLMTEHTAVRSMSTPDEIFPDPADVNFHLADALYRRGQVEAAIERYLCAIEFAPDFIEAWTQLGCLRAEQNEPALAEEAFLTAIAIHSANPDALLHYAQLLDGQQRADDAVYYWSEYLRYDSRGPWAEHARQRIKLAEADLQTSDES
ncbi:MAG: tetratricopeptide repeat protein [Fuerstiella sp.]